MQRLIKTLSLGLTWVARIATGLAFLVIIIAVVIQLLGRSGVIDSVIWSEELTRFALLWLVAFGAGLGLRSGALVNVDIFCEALPEPWPWRLRLFSAALTAVFAFSLLPSAAFFMRIGARQTAPALGIHMNWIHASALVTLAVLGTVATLRVIGMLAGTEKGRPDNLEDI
ncbi:TRAP-type C4-dicarboxylate transport system permease small subunit [Rhodobacter aestuarii]|uniref:TRAP transporter small permease protein n=1 Tax=Rhodobacter aestuarii TaxID=453582 RepID=A0A1N7IY44_9RHOB|nr:MULTISPECIES: TRAP transporter small permease subunit [Rhodobacter]PTV97400.1 TRAP-type C4-dicarboxylate transport system permease small subunit [Rhodobacter aestuarii]SIS42028.1 TRAP-type C4-dicarboxylate transport system, small permease component [Rhodobacter aestuarii]SOC00303.1 TRAP-type C4-dicarboxylate transport system permease small subunit [Rhodobacter sp. JA431]